MHHVMCDVWSEGGNSRNSFTQYTLFHKRTKSQVPAEKICTTIVQIKNTTVFVLWLWGFIHLKYCRFVCLMTKYFPTFLFVIPHPKNSYISVNLCVPTQYVCFMHPHHTLCVCSSFMLWQYAEYAPPVMCVSMCVAISMMFWFWFS